MELVATRYIVRDECGDDVGTLEYDFLCSSWVIDTLEEWANPSHLRKIADYIEELNSDD